MPCKQSIQLCCNKPLPIMTRQKLHQNLLPANLRPNATTCLAFLQLYHASRAHHTLPAKMGIKIRVTGQLCRKSPSCHIKEQSGTHPATLAWQSKPAQAAGWLCKKSCTLHRSCLSWPPFLWEFVCVLASCCTRRYRVFMTACAPWAGGAFKGSSGGCQLA